MGCKVGYSQASTSLLHLPVAPSPAPPAELRALIGQRDHSLPRPASGSVRPLLLAGGGYCAGANAEISPRVSVGPPDHRALLLEQLPHPRGGTHFSFPRLPNEPSPGSADVPELLSVRFRATIVSLSTPHKRFLDAFPLAER